MTVEEFEQAILDRAEGMEAKLATELADAAKQIQGQMKRGKFKNDTGALRRSIKVAVRGEGIAASMLRYGYYLSFGVDGYNRKGAVGLPADIASSFKVSPGYKFGSNKVPGIKNRNFYPDNMEEIIEEILLELIEE